MTEAWLHHNASINVNVGSVAEFATRVQNELMTSFAQSYADGVTPLMRVPVVFGGGGLQEGQFFGGLHQRNHDAATQMMADVALCLKALGDAARSIALEYLAGDAESGATVDDVYDAFSPTEAATPAGPDSTVVTMTEDPDAGDRPGPTDPDRHPTPVDPDGRQVIAAGESGEYVIPADNEGMRECAPPMPQPEH